MNGFASIFYKEWCYPSARKVISLAKDDDDDAYFQITYIKSALERKLALSKGL